MDNVEITLTPRQRDFPEGLGRKLGWKLGSGPGCPGGKPQVAAVGEVGKIVVGASVKKQEDVGVDDEKLLDLEVLRQKVSISDDCLAVKLISAIKQI